MKEYRRFAVLFRSALSIRGIVAQDFLTDRANYFQFLGYRWASIGIF